MWPLGGSFSAGLHIRYDGLHRILLLDEFVEQQLTRYTGSRPENR
jgi:hypothetical protein